MPPGHPIVLLKSNWFNMAAVSVKRSISQKLNHFCLRSLLVFWTTWVPSHQHYLLTGTPTLGWATLYINLFFLHLGRFRLFIVSLRKDNVGDFKIFLRVFVSSRSIFVRTRRYFITASTKFPATEKKHEDLLVAMTVILVTQPVNKWIQAAVDENQKRESVVQSGIKTRYSRQC